MDNLVLLIIIVIFLIIYILFCGCILKKKETFQDKPGYLLNRTGIEDIQVGGYFGNIPSDKTVYQGSKRSIPYEERETVKMIVREVLGKISAMLQLQFELVDVDYLLKKVEDNGNVRMRLDVFILEKLNHYNRRLLLDLTLDYTVKKIVINQIEMANAKNLKPVEDYPEHYFHQKVISEDNKINKLEGDIYGESDSKLAFGKLDYQHEHLNQKEFNNWILPQNYLDKINTSLPVWPCRLEDFRWDRNGVNITQIGSDKCQGINSSYSQKEYTPKFNFTFKSVNYDSPHNWLFGIPKQDGRNIHMGGSN